MPTSLGTSTFAIVVGGGVDVVVPSLLVALPAIPNLEPAVMSVALAEVVRILDSMMAPAL
jgi:hypothetical protein